uniref:VWFA domain-containing protein n=1 Tax=Sphaeramia orbicularis TaxID=375764 RepID=A0A673B3L3_9TELE
MLILLNGGRSYDNVDAPASALKQQGIVVIGIGAGRVKLNMSHVLCSLAERQPTGRDVVFLLDGSDGTRTEFPAVRDFVQRMVDTLSVDDSRDRVAVVQYSRDAAVQFYLNTYTTKAEILDTVRGLRHKGGRPLYTGAALQYVRDNVFTASAGSRRLEGVPQVLILLSGARSVDSVDAPASALKQLGVLTFAIGTRNADKREMQKIAHEPTHAVSVSEFNDLPNVQQQLQSSVEAVIVEVTPETPTAPGTLPSAEVLQGRDQGWHLLSSTGACPEGWRVEKSCCLTCLPVFPQLTLPKRISYSFWMASDATRNGFPAMRDFVERVVEKLNVGENKDRVSVVQYSREPEVHFYLNTYNTRADIVDTVRGLRHRGGRTLNTGAALQYVRDNVFTNSSGSRRLQGVPQMLILLNGGRSYDNVDAPASALKQQGIVVIGIGAGRADSAEMQKISSDPTYALSVSELTDLPSVHEQLSSVMSTVLVRATPITPTVTGKNVTAFYFSLMVLGHKLKCVNRMVDTLSVDDSRDRVAVVQYSRDAAVQFYLNTYTTKAEILDTVRGLRHKGGRPLYTGAALQYVRDNVFTASAGSRRLEGVPQVLILLSGARSVDSVDAPASALKQLGVLTFAIGTRNADKREMQKIAHEPTHAVSVSEFNDLPNVQQQLQSSVEAVIVEVTPETPTAPGTLPSAEVLQSGGKTQCRGKQRPCLCGPVQQGARGPFLSEHIQHQS